MVQYNWLYVFFSRSNWTCHKYIGFGLSNLVGKFYIYFLVNKILIKLKLYFYRKKDKNAREAKFLINLAVADLLKVLVNIPMSVTSLFSKQWVFGYFGIILPFKIKSNPKI